MEMSHQRAPERKQVMWQKTHSDLKRYRTAIEASGKGIRNKGASGDWYLTGVFQLSKWQESFFEPAVEKKVNITRRNRSEILKERFERLPAADQSFFQTGSLFLSINSSLCGLVANSLFRRILNITQARFAASLPMAVLPFITTAAVYETSINQPLMEGDLNCTTCALVRGGLIGASVGSLYPALLALPLNAGLATRYINSYFK
ncbi:transmembrane protein 126A [Sceloporus undulatus]|uniref:transmembrane protein 126A n=1 Tax=Sceloporus undulatus TaxID=8520 RepID=UPI001C4CA21C|nr:transmembrane protein 126A [Sceloporus undulatus]